MKQRILIGSLVLNAALAAGLVYVLLSADQEEDRAGVPSVEETPEKQTGDEDARVMDKSEPLTPFPDPLPASSPPDDSEPDVASAIAQFEAMGMRVVSDRLLQGISISLIDSDGRVTDAARERGDR